MQELPDEQWGLWMNFLQSEGRLPPQTVALPLCQEGHRHEASPQLPKRQLLDQIVFPRGAPSQPLSASPHKQQASDCGDGSILPTTSACLSTISAHRLQPGASDLARLAHITQVWGMEGCADWRGAPAACMTSFIITPSHW